MSVSPSELPSKENLDDDNAPTGCKACCLKATKVVFSHVGLILLVAAYSAVGGFIFQHLEKTNEIEECKKAAAKYAPELNQTVDKFWEMTRQYSTDEYKENALDNFRQQLEKWRDTVLDLGYSGTDCALLGQPGGDDFKWSFTGALVFSVTVITTIGYGHISPKTFWGRLVCIAYATLGIPLMLLCLANIGDVLADIFRFVYSKVCCCGCCRKKRPPQNSGSQAGDDDGTDSPSDWQKRYGHDGPDGDAGAAVVEDDYDDDEEDDEDTISVPLTVTLAVIGMYVFLGALLFGYWEKWGSLEAAYFCYVTISTIGFGDLVPGSTALKDSSQHMKMVVNVFYMIFGMALLSMCFSLIQEEVVGKFKWIGDRLSALNARRKARGSASCPPPPPPPPASASAASAASAHSSGGYDNRAIEAGGGEMPSMMPSNMPSNMPPKM